MNRTAGRAGPLDRGERRTLLGLCVVALLTAMVGIGTKSFWFDEGYSAELARQPVGTWWRLLFEQEGGALLHAMLLKPWLAVSDADGWLRFLSVPFAVGQVVLTYFLARRVIGGGAWAAALALAVNGAFVQYAQEGRAYAMASFFVLAAALAFLRAVERPDRSRLAVFVVLAALCPLAHLYTAPFVGALGVALLFGDPAQPWRRWVGAGGAILLAWAVLVAVVLVAGSGGAQPRDEIADRVSSLSFVPRQFLSPTWAVGWVLLLLAALWLVPVVSVLRGQGRSERSLVVVVPPAMVGAPLVVALLVPQIDLDTSRYLLPILPFLLIMATGSVASLSRRVRPTWTRPVLGVGLVAVVVLSAVGLVHWHVDDEKMDARAWTARLADGVQPGDRVVFDDVFARVVTEHYLHQAGVDLNDATSVRPPEPFGEYFWDPERDTIGDCLADDLDPGLAISERERTWIVVAVPETCWSTERVQAAIDRAGRTVVERIDLDGPSSLLLVE